MDDSLFNGHPPKAGATADGGRNFARVFRGHPALGLKLDAEKTPVDVIEVDDAERYSAN